MTTRLKYLYRRTVKGNPYVYFRSPDGSLTPLPADETSAEFRRCYAACLKSIAPPKVVKAPTSIRRVNERVGFLSGTIGAAIDRYVTSIEFESTKPSTKIHYRIALDIIRDRLGTGRLADLDLDAVDIYSEAITQTHGASIAARQVSLLSNIWRVCRKHPEFKIKGIPNPTTDATRRYKVRAPHKPWDDAAEAKFMASAPDNLKLAKLLLHFGGQRAGDCVKMKWTDFDGRGLTVIPEKGNRGGEPEPNYHLCPKPLLDALLTAPRVADTILVTKRGLPFANATTLGQAIREHLRGIGLVKAGTKSLTMHGLRKNAACDVASLGVGVAGIKSITGQKTDRMANYYAERFNKHGVNAMTVALWDQALANEAAAHAVQVKARRAAIRRVK
jgi:integrase